MSNPTTPFSWQMPENTDLVTDLPADFEVFGQAVATSMADLLGGTTGQVLAKASNTDMDFVWSADAAGMTNPMTTTGDVIYSSPGSTPVRLGIGSNGNVLTVAAGVPSWSTPAPASSGLNHISTTAFSNVATQDFSAVFSATYKSYLIVINKISAATIGNALHLQLRYGSSVFAGTYYGDSFVYGGANTNTSGGTELIISSATGGSGYTSAGFFYIYNVADASGYATVSGQYTDGYNLAFKSFGGIAYGANNYNGFRLKSSSSNITGNVSIYGLGNS